jgi:general secretion pathway protein K
MAACAARMPERGFALIIVLWGLVLLSLIVGEIGAASRSEAKIARNLLANAQAEAAADAAVFEAAFRLADRSPAGWVADGGTRRLTVGDTRVAVTLEDDSGKVNPNAATPDLLAQLLAAVGAPGGGRAIAQAIVDWRGGDGAAPPDAVAAAYRAAGLAYLPPGAPFARIDEVALVLGMTPDLFARLAPHLSIAQRGTPDPSHADPVVARLLAAQPGAASSAGKPASPYTVRVVTIIARAEAPGNALFTRSAVLQLGIGPALPRGYAIIAWDAPASE